MKRINYFMFVMVLLTTLMVGCSSIEAPKEPPEIEVTIGDKDIKYVIGKNKWDNAIYDREDTFKTLLNKQSIEGISYIEIGEIAHIDFKNYPPDELMIDSILLNENGNPIYEDMNVNIIPALNKDNSYSFEINKHMASYLSSMYIEGQTYIIGYRMTAFWDDNECEYGFIIRTGTKEEAKIIKEEEQRRVDLYTEVLRAAFLEENGGNEFIAVKLDTLEGLSDEAKSEVLKNLTNLSPNVYSFEDVKSDSTKFEIDGDNLIRSKDGSLLWIEIEEYTESKATITGVSWFGNLGAVFPKYEATYKNGIWNLKLISMAIS